MEIAAINYYYEQESLARNDWSSKYGNLTMEELPIAVLRNFSDLTHHSSYIDQISSQDALFDYVMERNGFAKQRNRIFPEDKSEIGFAINKISDKSLLRKITEQCGNWYARAYASKILGDRKCFLRAVLSQPSLDDYIKALNAEPLPQGDLPDIVQPHIRTFFMKKRGAKYKMQRKN